MWGQCILFLWFYLQVIVKCTHCWCGLQIFAGRYCCYLGQGLLEAYTLVLEFFYRVYFLNLSMCPFAVTKYGGKFFSNASGLTPSHIAKLLVLIALIHVDSTGKNRRCAVNVEGTAMWKCDAHEKKRMFYSCICLCWWCDCKWQETHLNPVHVDQLGCCHIDVKCSIQW